MRRIAKRACTVTISVVTALTMIASTAFADPNKELSTLNAGITTSFEQSYFTNQVSVLANTFNEPVAAAPDSLDPEINAALAKYNNLGVAKLVGHLNIRQEPSLEGEILGKIPSDAGCEILEELDGWYKISSGDVTGYVSSEYMIKGQEAYDYARTVIRHVVTTTDPLRLREAPNTECEVIMVVAEGEELEILEDNNGWVKVEINGDVGYLSKEFAEIGYKLKHAMSMDEIRFGTGISIARSNICNEALKYIGNPYVWGGTSLTHGADCSGFVLALYSQLGIYLPHFAQSQAGYGVRIDPSQAQPGDLFFYGAGGYINHVGMYIGGGMIVHAATESIGITISSAYYSQPVCVTSLLD